MKPDVSIIVINYKNWPLTMDCIESILSDDARRNIEIIVVDNDSQDGSYEHLSKLLSPAVTVIDSGSNSGFSAGNNLGALYATGRYLFFLNNDTIIKPGVLDEMIDILEAHEELGALTCQSVDGNGDYLNNGHSFPTIWTMIKEIIVRPCIPDSARAQLRKKRSGQATRLISCYDWISGSALLISSDLFCKIGGWDESFFMYMEDVSLCQEIAKQGKACGVYERLGFVHFHGDAAGSPRVIFEAGKSEIMYYKKYGSENQSITRQLAILRAKRRAKKFGTAAVKEMSDSLKAV